MTLTELRYLVILAQERHFGRAAERCHVAQPTLSVAIRKLEESLDLVIFERHRHGVLVTAAGLSLINQAQTILNEVDTLEQMANQARDEFTVPLRLGAIFTVGPYLFPSLIRQLRQQGSQLKLYLEENYTHVLSEQLARGDIDAILVALPFEPPETRITPIFNEPFQVLLPHDHEWAEKPQIDMKLLTDNAVLMLGEGHCFRDQILDTCSVSSAAGSGTGSSLMTLRHMVASGLGITLIPACAAPVLVDADVVVRPLKPSPTRCIALASRYRFPRQRALQELTQALHMLNLAGTEPVYR